MGKKKNNRKTQICRICMKKKKFKKFVHFNNGGDLSILEVCSKCVGKIREESLRQRRRLGV